jgi:RNA-directed DNA polymerase
MKESYGEGVATHTGPESCVDVREGVGEALTGVRAGQPLSREIRCIQGANAVRRAEGNTKGAALARRASTLRGLRPCACTETHHAGSGRSHTWPGRTGPCREPYGGTTAMHGRGKSDGPIVLKNLANKGHGAPRPAEWGEGRGPAKGNPIRDVRYRTQSRIRLNAS